VNFFFDQDEAVFRVERLADRVGLEYFNFELFAQGSSVIHQGTSDPATVECRVDENSSNFVAD
jgi:hypothetical protein